MPTTLEGKKLACEIIVVAINNSINESSLSASRDSIRSILELFKGLD